MANRADITPELCRQLLRYEPETGKLFWRRRASAMFAGSAEGRERATLLWNARYAGTEAFTARTTTGYLHGNIFSRKFKAHRVIWAIVHGAWPKYIDHQNGDRTDNRLANLRSVSKCENSRNVAISSRNSSGCPGVSWDKARGKWMAVIRSDKAFRHLGRFEKKSDAIAARKAAERDLGFHRNHGRQTARARNVQCDAAASNSAERISHSCPRTVIR